MTTRTQRQKPASVVTVEGGNRRCNRVLVSYVSHSLEYTTLSRSGTTLIPRHLFTRPPLSPPLSSFLSFFLSFFLSSSLKEKASYSFFPYLHTDTVCVWRHGHNGNCRPRQSTIHKGPQRSDENPFPGKLVWIAAVPMIRKRGILSFILSYVTIYRD